MSAIKKTPIACYSVRGTRFLQHRSNSISSEHAARSLYINSTTANNFDSVCCLVLGIPWFTLSPLLAMRCVFGPRQNISRFDTVCQGCSDAANNTVPDGVEISNERETPSCQAIPSGTVATSIATTVESLTLEKGFYRTSKESDVVMECYRSEACLGGSDPDEYCAEGYEGACECRVPSTCTILD